MDRDDFALATQAFSRVTNILDKAGDIKPVQNSLLADGAEKLLWERYLAVRPVVERHIQQGAWITPRPLRLWRACAAASTPFSTT